jgi:hypothetical protein
MSYTPIGIIKSAIDDIKEFVSRLSVLASVVWVLSDIRVTPTGTVTVAWSLTTITTVTTVGTVSNQTLIWWYQAWPQVPSTMNIEATLANIDNIIIS